MFLILWNFLLNVKAYSGVDVTQLPMFQEIMVFSDETRFSWFFAELFPFLVVMPAAFSIMHDKKNHTDLFLITRSGYFQYYFSKAIAVFFATLCCFVIPFMIELFLYGITYPMDATGHVCGYESYSYNGEYFADYMWADLYFNNPFLYCLKHIMVVGIMAGTLSLFTLAISTLKIRYMSFLMIPVYLLLYIGRIIHYNIIEIEKDSDLHFNYASYLKSCHIRVNEGNYHLLFAILFILMIVSCILLYRSKRKGLL